MMTNTTYFPSEQIEKRLIKRLLQACIREKLLSYQLKDNVLLISLPRNKKSITIDQVQIFELGKFRLNGEISLIEDNHAIDIKNIHHLLSLIYAEIKDNTEPDQWSIFADEINNCVINDTLSTAHIHAFNQDLAHKMNQLNYSQFLDYIHKNYSIAEQLMFFERWSAKGHPYHPCHKTKLGFNKDAYIKFSPEFNQDIHLPLAAIEKSLMHVENEQQEVDYHQWFSIHFHKEWHAWQQKMMDDGLPISEYVPLFIHPWQYEETLKKLFPTLIEGKQLILFNDISITTKASLSFRTLIAQENHLMPHIKLPIAVHSTSAMRTISPASVQNGPKLGKILRKILADEAHFDSRLDIAFEMCSLHVTSYPSDIAKHLGIIYRENPAHYVKKNQIPIVVAALFEEVPNNKLSLFIDIIKSATDGSFESAISYFDHYCRIVIHAFLDLFLIYGIALEGHQQNTITVFENDQPHHMIVRDLGGLRVHLPTLQQHGFVLEAYPDSATITHDDTEVTNKFLHTVIQYHLGELVLLLTEYYQTQESLFWEIIRNNLAQRFELLRNKVDATRWQREYSRILEEDWQLKGLMSMRLNNVYNKYIYINLNNPLRKSA